MTQRGLGVTKRSARHDEKGAWRDKKGPGMTKTPSRTHTCHPALPLLSSRAPTSSFRTPFMASRAPSLSSRAKPRELNRSSLNHTRHPRPTVGTGSSPARRMRVPHRGYRIKSGMTMPSLVLPGTPGICPTSSYRRKPVSTVGTGGYPFGYGPAPRNHVPPPVHGRPHPNAPTGGQSAAASALYPAPPWVPGVPGTTIRASSIGPHPNPLPRGEGVCGEARCSHASPGWDLVGASLVGARGGVIAGSTSFYRAGVVEGVPDRSRGRRVRVWAPDQVRHDDAFPRLTGDTRYPWWCDRGWNAHTLSRAVAEGVPDRSRGRRVRVWAPDRGVA